MSDTAYYENQYEAAPQSGRWKGVFGGLAAAVLSLSMLGGVIAWTYQISNRDAFDVPVIRAVEGDLKRRPENSGGLVLEGKDASVTRMVSGDAGGGEATLAPESEQLAPEDKPVEVIQREASNPNDPPKPAPVAQISQPGVAEEEAVIASAPSPGPASPVQAAPEPETGSSTGTPVKPLEETDVTEQAPNQSPRVQQRPKTLDTTAIPTPTTSSTNTPVTRQAVAIGEPVLQLGAFTSRQIAERVWKDQKVVNRRLFRGLDSTITTVQSGGRELYRLRVGPFASDNDARKICVVLKARGTDCIVTRAE